MPEPTAPSPATLKKGRWIIGIMPLIVTIALGADCGFRCLRQPLTKDEAIARARARLERYSQTFNVKETINSRMPHLNRTPRFG
jgi:hypothetical protein